MDASCDHAQDGFYVQGHNGTLHAKHNEYSHINVKTHDVNNIDKVRDFLNNNIVILIRLSMTLGLHMIWLMVMFFLMMMLMLLLIKLMFMIDIFSTNITNM